MRVMSRCQRVRRGGGSAVVQAPLAVQAADKNDAFRLRQDRCLGPVQRGWGLAGAVAWGSVTSASQLPRGRRVPTLGPVVAS